MTFCRLLSAVLVPICWALLSVAEQNVTRPAGATAAPRPAVTNSSGVNSTHGGGGSGNWGREMFNGVGSSMMQRGLYVLIGFTLIGVLYFLIRAVRLKKPAHKKKYGLLSNYDDSVEMEAVESDEDDTLYEARSLRR
ncbi:protein FAM174C [Lates calcarifer]|nr:protein FAM174C [Lates calcarifer]